MTCTNSEFRAQFTESKYYSGKEVALCASFFARRDRGFPGTAAVATVTGQETTGLYTSTLVVVLTLSRIVLV